MLSGQRGAEQDEEEERPQRATRGQANGSTSNYIDHASDDESDAASSWKGDDESQNENEFEGDDEGELSDDESMLDIDDAKQHSLVVHLHYGKTNEPQQSAPSTEPPPATDSDHIPPDPNPTKTEEVVTDLHKSTVEERTVDNEVTTRNGSSEEKHQEQQQQGQPQTAPSSSAVPPHFEDSKENVSAHHHQGLKPEEVSKSTTTQEQLPIASVAPLEPSRMQNGTE